MKSDKRRCTVCDINNTGHEMKHSIMKCSCNDCGVRFKRLECLENGCIKWKATDPSHSPSDTQIGNNNLPETLKD